MKKINWDNIEEINGEFKKPIAGGYIAKICNIEDNEEREYLKIYWDYAEGEFKDYNQQTYDRIGFWTTSFIRSYKDSALGFFKAFKNVLEESNPRYKFNEEKLSDMKGKLIGIILGEEEYMKMNGEVGRRLYVYKTCSIEKIKKGEYFVPDFKPYLTIEKPAKNDEEVPF